MSVYAHEDLRPSLTDSTPTLLAKILQRIGGTQSVNVLNSEEVAPKDAFGRLRVSDVHTLIDSKQVIDYGSNLWSDAPVSGAGTGSVHQPLRASTLLSVSANTAGVRARQTLRRFNYQPGKAQAAKLTFVMGAPTPGITKRAGLFEAENGLFFEVAPTGPAFVIRSGVTGAPVDDRFPQAIWNTDKLDGTGPSGAMLDTTKAQIFFVEFEWLGSGTVFFGFFIDGKRVYCHEDHHANRQSSVYMTSPNLPIRYEISNDGTGAAATLESICCTCESEGGSSAPGLIFSADRGTTYLTAAAGGVLNGLLGLRLKSGAGRYATVLPQRIALICPTESTIFRWALLRNPTVAGTPTWSASSPATEACTTATAANTVTGGTLLASGYFAGVREAGGMDLSLGRDSALGVALDGVSDQIWLAVQEFASTQDRYAGSLMWTETG